MTSYEGIIHSLEHIILMHGLPSNLQLPDIPVVSSSRWIHLLQEYNAERDAGTSAKGYFTDTNTYPNAAKWRDELFKSVVLIQEGYGHIRQLAQSQLTPMIAQLRYQDYALHKTYNNNNYKRDWVICLDILTRSETTHELSSVPGGATRVGVYSPLRGQAVEHISMRLETFPTLLPVKRDPIFTNPPSPSDQGTLSGKISHETGSPPTPAPIEWITGYVSPFEAAQAYGEPEVDANGDPTFPRITSVEMHDSTDLNYWTLLWAHGVPEDYQGYYPTTLQITVCEDVHRAWDVYRG